MDIVFSYPDAYCIKVDSVDNPDFTWLIIGTETGARNHYGTGHICINGNVLDGHQLAAFLRRTVPGQIMSRVQQVILAISNSGAPYVAQHEGSPPAYHVQPAAPLPSYSAACERRPFPPSYQSLHPSPSFENSINRSIAQDLAKGLGRPFFVLGFQGQLDVSNAWNIYASIHYNRPPRVNALPWRRFRTIPAHQEPFAIRIGGPFLHSYLFHGDLWCGTRYNRGQGAPVSMDSLRVTFRDSNYWARGDHGRVI
ncbi:hypothetical protein [Cupriavidus pauculus]|uniref:hypothetical protein n=1 Tax=Cupriavidus pauculus TaxID=82633 RepID=UPI001243BA63|nr:hypothetical protein [Cupriavidus pauculus]KAB0603755.1 hypothetical protein F7R19_06425 [Cupriavidus pauculus]UAL03423.1 hypothetical protein K8O84_22635 [Cupriavidus pauculus]